MNKNWMFLKRGPFSIGTLLLLFSLFFYHSQVSAQSCIAAPSGLLSWWDADADCYPVARDIQGPHPGWYENGACACPGFVNKGFCLDGVDDYIRIPDADSLSFGDGNTDRPFSVELWLWTNDVSGQRFLFKGGHTAREYSFGITNTYPDHLIMSLYDDDRPNGGSLKTIARQSNATLTADEGGWVHLAGTYDGSGSHTGIKLYRNGVQMATSPVHLSGTYTAMHNQAQDAVIGRHFTDYPMYSGGIVDELSLYARELSSTEILAIYQASAAGKCKNTCTPPPSGMIGWWDGDSANAGVARDIWGIHSGSLENGTGYGLGQVCQALDLDGVDDYVLIPDHDQLSFGDGQTDQPFSVDLWLNTDDVSGQRLFFKGGNTTREYSFGITNTYPDHLIMGLYDDDRVSGGSLKTIARRSTATLTGDEGKWVHLAGTYDGSGSHTGIKLYRNGVQMATIPVHLSGTYVAMHNQEEGAVIGRHFTDYSFYSGGKVDEVELFDRVLSQSEIEAIYQAGARGKCKPGCDPAAAMGKSGEEINLREEGSNWSYEIAPNPFNQKLRFTLTSQEEKHVVLELFDLSGRMQAQLFRGRVLSGEPLSDQWDLSDLSPGIYFYRLQIGEEVQTGKLLRKD